MEVGWLTAQYLLSQLPVLQGGLCEVAKLLLGLVDGADAENLTYPPICSKNFDGQDSIL